MKIDYISDLHFEINGYHDWIDKKFNGGDVLVIAGDLSCARFFRPNRTDAEARTMIRYIDRLSENVFNKYKKVIILIGNHEHYKHIFNDTVSVYQEFFKRYKNVIVMEKDCLIIDDIVFIGCTLWTDGNKQNPLDIRAVESGMNDYYIIYKYDSNNLPYHKRKQAETSNSYILKMEDTILDHYKSIEYIDKICSLNKDKKIIVCTHHAPSYKSNEAFRTSGISAGYCSELSEFILERPQIKYWIHGHTHTSMEYSIGKCQIVSKQYGYNYNIPQQLMDFDPGEIKI